MNDLLNELLLDTSKFRALLFTEGATTCYTESPYGYRVKTEPSKDDVFFCINELHPSADLNPTKDWHDRNQPRRADCNVVSFRNFLIELDKMPLDEQITYVRSRIPVSSIVYSGGASYHFIVSLETPLPDYNTYMSWSRRLLALVPQADPACKNPSRLSRLPSRLRLDTGKEQALVYLGERVPNAQIETLLAVETPRPQRTYTADEKKQYVTPLILEAVIEPDLVMSRSGMTRNLFFYWLYNRFEDIGATREQREKYVTLAYDNLQNTYDFTFEEACAAARIGRN